MRLPGLLQTRVARRTLVLFLACALLPVTLLAVSGYRYLSSELETRAREQLRADSKNAGMVLLDRLAALASILDRNARDLRPEHLEGFRADQSEAGMLGPRLAAVILEERTGFVTTVYRAADTVPATAGVVESIPRVDPRMAAHLAAGEVGLILAPGPGAVRVFLVRQVQDGGRLWGLVDGESVWGLAPERRLVPGEQRFCLASAAGVPIQCQDEGAARAVPETDDGATFSWGAARSRFVAGQWTIFLGRTFGAPSWKLIVSRPEATIFAPLAALRRSFLLGLLLALATVFALSHVQIRRHTAPLEALQAATERVAQGRFDQPVPVTTDDEFGQLAGSFNGMSADLERQFRLQAALARVHRAALAGHGAGPILDVIAEAREALVPGTGLTVALARPDDPLSWQARSINGALTGPRDLQPPAEELEEFRRHPNGFVVRRGERGRSYFESPGQPLRSESLVLPLLRQGAVDGALVVHCRPDQEGQAEATEAIRRATNHLAVAIANTQLVGQLDAMNWGTLTALARTIDAVSPWTAGHSERVTIGALEIGRRLQVGADDLDLLHRGGLLHDIGKVGVPADILDKPGKLTPEEYARIQQHPAIGARILAPIGAVRRALPLVLHHHELLDGSGYPDGLAGERIPRLVRILTVADVFDALVSDRPYRPAWPVEQAMAYFHDLRGVKFDAEAVEALAAATAGGWRPIVTGSSGVSTLRGSGRAPLEAASLSLPASLVRAAASSTAGAGTA